MKLMLKAMFVVVILASLCKLSHAGGSQATFYSGQPPLYNTEIIGSSVTTLGTANLTVALAPGTVSGSSCRNCFTKFFVQIPTTSIVTILDSGTTVQTIDGQGLAASGVNPYLLNYDNQSPMCLGFGNTTTINCVTTSGVTTNHQVINYEGFVSCGNAGGSTLNAGK